MWTGLLLVCGLAFSLQAQQDPTDLLLKVRGRVKDSVNRLPKYMCTQTIDRQQYEPVKGKQAARCDDGPAQKDLHVTTSDRLRFDVGVTGAGEIYAWAGAKRFDDRSLFDLVREGSISNGIFAAFLRAIFRTEDATFSYNGDTTEDGRALTEFGFRVPLERSHYVFVGSGDGVTTAYEGEIFVDPQTSDLARLVVRTSGLPPETGSCQATTTLVYGRVRLEGGDFLLPTVARSLVRHINGIKSENRTVFSNCHEFLGESTVTFDLPPDAGAAATAASPAPAAPTLPAGLRFTVRTTQDIQTATAAAGDLIQAKLTTAIVAYSKQVLAPAGAVITARLVRIRQFFGGVSSVSLGLKLETIELGGVSVPLRARPNFALRTFTTLPGSRPPQVELGTLSDLEDRDVVVFEFRNVQLQPVISHGLESSWVVIDPNEPEPAMGNIVVRGPTIAVNSYRSRTLTRAAGVGKSADAARKSACATSASQ
jgi:hypothetical protein